MIFNVPNHIQYIRNGLPNRRIQILQLIPEVTKTQTRRVNRGIYKVGKDYAVQRKRGVKAEPDIRIVMDKIWEEVAVKTKLDEYYPPYGMYISQKDAWSEGGYIPSEYERIFRELNSKWGGTRRWAFEFHVIEVYTTDEKEIYRKFDEAQRELDGFAVSFGNYSFMKDARRYLMKGELKGQRNEL